MQRTEAKQDDTSWEDVIPEEITTNILYRLPVKSLGRCQLVCKTWYVIISNPRFVESHHALASRNAQTSETINILYRACDTSFLLKLWDSDLVVSEGLNLTLFDYPVSRSTCIIGSSHGLICVQIESYDGPLFFYLGNPITKKSMEIPNPPSCDRYEQRLVNLEASWFGFVPSVDDYKIVLVLYDADCVDFGRPVIEVEWFIYSVRKAAWKILKRSMTSDIDGFIGCNKAYTCTPLLFNDVLHFMPCYGDFFFYYFDLIKETTIEIPNEFPVYDDPKLEETQQSIGVIQDKLCVCRYYNWLPMLEVWMVEQYGKWDSWKKLYKVDLLGKSFMKGVYFTDLVCFTLTGQVLVSYEQGTAGKTGHRILVFDPTRQCYYVHETSINMVGYCMVKFVESLISPFSIGLTE